MNRALWTLRDVSLPGRSGPRLDRVTVEIPAGVCAVAGPSGAGKTSLLNLLVGFERPQSGTIERDQAIASADRNGSGRLRVYWCPPDDGLWTHLTVREHLETVSPAMPDARPGVATLDEASSTECVARPDKGVASVRNLRHAHPVGLGVPPGGFVVQLLTMFQLSALADARPDSLSEGERSRLSVARALATRARVLVMDEPLSHVNRSLRSDCWNALRSICAEQGTSLVFSSHDPEIILREAAHVICLEHGRLVWSGPVAELYARPVSAALAEFVGPVNWFEPDEAAAWLGESISAARGVRPEGLELKAAADGPLTVEECIAVGSLSEIRLRDDSGRCRTFVHATRGAPPQRGHRVKLSAMLSAVLALLMAGCGGSSEEAATLPVVSTRVWSLPVEEGRMPAPRAMTFSPQGELFVLDDIGRVVVYGTDGQLSRKWWMPEYSVGRPEGIIVMHDGRLAIADTHYHRVVFFSQAGELQGTFGEEGEGPGQFIYPCDVAEDAQGNLYVAEYGGNDRVQKFSADMTFLTEFGDAGTGPGQFQRMGGLAWHEGNLFVCDIINNRVQRFDDSGKLLGELTLSGAAFLEYPYDVTIAADGRIDIIEYKSGRVSQMTLAGEMQGRYGTTGRGAGEFWTPWGLASTPDGRIVVADTGNRRIVELSL